MKRNLVKKRFYYKIKIGTIIKNNELIIELPNIL